MKSKYEVITPVAATKYRSLSYCTRVDAGVRMLLERFEEQVTSFDASTQIIIELGTDPWTQSKTCLNDALNRFECAINDVGWDAHVKLFGTTVVVNIPEVKLQKASVHTGDDFDRATSRSRDRGPIQQTIKKNGRRAR